MKDTDIPQHKRMAMGEKLKFARGGAVGMLAPQGPANTRLLRTGIPDTPIENAKRANGIPGLKKGGKAKAKK